MDDSKLHEGLQSDPNSDVTPCIHGVYWNVRCRKCIIELRDRERHEMLRESFERLTSVLEKIERKL